MMWWLVRYRDGSWTKTTGANVLEALQGLDIDCVVGIEKDNTQ